MIRLTQQQPYAWDESKVASRDRDVQVAYFKSLVKQLRSTYGEIANAVNQVVTEAERLTTIDIGTMTGHETFLRADGRFFERDPGVAPRNFNPSGNFNAGDEVVLINTATGAVAITFDSAGLAAAVAQNQRGIFVYNGTVWRKVFVG